MTQAPPRPQADHHDDEFRIGNAGWFVIGALGTFLVVIAVAFAILMARTSDPDYTVELATVSEEEVAEGAAGSTDGEEATAGGEEAPVGGAGAAELTLIGTEFAFDPMDATIAAGGSLTLDNQGLILHNLEIEGIAGFVLETEAGETATATVEAPPGTYAIFCSIPGHREAGMEGTLTVEG